MKFRIYSYIKFIIAFLFWLSVGVFSAFCIYFFYYPETHIIGKLYVNPFYSFVENMPLWLYAVIIFTFLSFIMSVSFVLMSMYYSLKKSKTEKNKLKYYSFFTRILTNYYLSYIYKDESYKEKLVLRLRPFVKKNIQVISLFEAHLKIQETLALDLSNDCKFLINKLQIYDKISALLFSQDFSDKILAMKVLSYLRIRTYTKQIVRLANNSNYSLRTEAYVALVRLMNKDECLHDIFVKEHSLSMLDVNIIVNAILKNRKMDIDYNMLLTSKSSKINILGLMLVKNRFERGSAVIFNVLQYVSSNNELVRKAAWDTFLAITEKEKTIDVIIEKFENEVNDIKFFILKRCLNIANKRLCLFLESILEKQILFVKIEAIKIIFEYDFDLLARISSSENEEILMAYNEVTSVFINK